jgi:hypothetical protein
MPSLPDDARAADLPATDPGDGLTVYTPLQQYTLLRATRLGTLRREVLPTLDASDYRVKLISKALYSTYCDLQALGLPSETRILREHTRTERVSG